MPRSRYGWRKKQADSHADDWLMTYADMITLLLCFFAVFLSVSLAKNIAPKEPRIETRAAAEDVLPPMPKPSPQPEVKLEMASEIRLPMAPSLVREKVEADEPVIAPVAAVPVAAGQDGAASPPVQAETPPQPESAKQGGAAAEQKGDRLTSFEMSSATFFDSGSAVLNDAGKVALRGVAEKIKSDAFRDYQVTVEGHTDDTPIKTAQFPSNWELSTARASAVVHFFIEQGVPAARMRAAGYADSMPKLPNRDAAGLPLPANQAQNRRVVIQLERIDHG